MATASGGDRADSVDRDSPSLVEYQQAILSDVSALASLASRSRQATWVAVPDLARERWAELAPAGTLRVDAIPDLWADREWLGMVFDSLFDGLGRCPGVETVVVGYESDCLFVADDGPALPVGSRDRVLASGVTAPRDRSGYGLSVLTHVARAHDWGLRLREGSDGGARFEFAGVQTRDRAAPGSV